MSASRLDRDVQRNRPQGLLSGTSKADLYGRDRRKDEAARAALAPVVRVQQ